tara:strand:- start:3432 stop:4853 length:1422 start_codon:yes stop_codon:yes gene_type:complete
MAYKFQVGNAILSGSLTQEGSVEIQNDAGAVVGIFDNTGVLSGALGATAASFTADGALEGGSLVVGAADLNATDLLKIDAITNGAGAANKALVLNADSVIASGLVGLTASSGIKAGELEAQGHVLAPAIISTTTIQGAAISGSGDLNANRLAIGGPNYAGALAKIDDAGAATFASVTSVGNVSGSEFQIAGNVVVANTTRISSAGAATFTSIAGTSISGSGVLSINQIKSSGSIAGTDFEVGGLLKMPDVTSGKILVADGTSFQEVALSGDATIASNGALTLANNSVSQAQLDDDAVGADELAANAVVNGSVVDGALKADKFDIDGSTDIGADLVDADLFVVDDGANGTNRKSELTRVKKYIYSAISGDATVNDSGVLTISAGSSDVAIAGDGTKLSSGYNYFTGSVSARCELPSGSIGTVVTVKAGNTAVGDAITITGSFSDTIDGATSVLLESPFAAVTCIYMRAGEWKIV